MQSKILCRHHNSKLSYLDEEAGGFVKSLIACQTAPDLVPEEMEFDGEKIERWMLKTLISLDASGGLTCAPLTDIHKEILLGAPWPEGWGLYAEASKQPTVITPDMHIDFVVNAATNDLIAATLDCWSEVLAYVSSSRQ